MICNEHTEKEEIQPFPDGRLRIWPVRFSDDVEELLHIPVEEDFGCRYDRRLCIQPALGHTPHVHDEVLIGAYTFTVLEIHGCIVRLRAVPRAPRWKRGPRG